MVFDNYVNEFFGRQKPTQKKSSDNQITLDEYQELRRKAEKYDELKQEYKNLEEQTEKLQNQLQDQQEKNQELQEQVDKYYNSLARVQADFQNYKKRIERDNINYRKYATESILKKLINHYEDLKRSLEILNALDISDSVKKGYEMIVDNFKKLLKEEGVEQMECIGEEFDPYRHEAMLVENKEDLPEDTILEVFENGYYCNDKVLRPAKVKISKKSN